MAGPWPVAGSDVWLGLGRGCKNAIKGITEKVAKKVTKKVVKKVVKKVIKKVIKNPGDFWGSKLPGHFWAIQVVIGRDFWVVKLPGVFDQILLLKIPGFFGHFLDNFLIKNTAVDPR